MCDFDDDFEDSFEEKMDEPFTDDTELDDKPEQDESQDDVLRIDPFVLGGAMGFAYEEGLREGKRRKRKRFGDDSD